MIDRIRPSVERFRRALEQGGLRLPTLANFPAGSCGDASELLGQYLADRGCGDWAYRSGTAPGVMRTHAWIEQGEVLVDITADQFGPSLPAVIITTDPDWHYENFPPGRAKRTAGLVWFDHSTVTVQALADYQVLTSRADGANSQPVVS